MHQLIREAKALAARAETESARQSAAQLLDRAKTIAHKEYLRSLPRRRQGTGPHHENPWGSDIPPPWDDGIHPAPVPPTATPDPQPERDRFLDSPIAWFGELLIAVERGNYDRAAEAQRELLRLGWKVTRAHA